MSTIAYLINLDRSTERLTRFYRRNSHLRHVPRWSAVDGAKLDRQQLIASGRIADDLPYSPGTLGCALSHIALWEHAVQQDAPVTIFEDDVAIHPQFDARVEQVVAALPPDWDFIQWGATIGFNVNLAAWIDLGRIPVKIDGHAPVKWSDEESYCQFQKEPIPSAAPMRLLHSYGLFGYSISAKGARLALENALPLRKRQIILAGRWWMHDNGLDVTMCGLYPQIKAYLCFPQLVIPCLDESERKATDAA